MAGAGDDGDAAAWTRRLDTPWGRLQASLLRGRLLRSLGSDRLGSVLDVGCGVGDLAEALAPWADRLVCVDRSAAMLDEARRRLSNADATIAFERRDLADGLTDLGTHDLVVAHNVVDYADDPRKAVQVVVDQVGPLGRLSICFGNGAALALRHAVMTHDLAGALRLSRLPRPRLPAPCGSSARLRRPVVEHWLDDAGLQVIHRAGVRVLVDLLPDGLKTDDALPMIEQLELELGDRPELVDVGALVHLVASRP